MDIRDFLKRLKSRRDIGDWIVHHRIIPRIKPSYSVPDFPLNEAISERLKRQGIHPLYIHQALGIDLVRQGKNVVVMTPTASGKSLIFNIPVLEAIIEDPETHAIYLYPLKGLEQDQIKNLRDLAEGLPIENPCEIYDGDTSSYRRRKIRESPPCIVMTNPDMLHLGICAFHEKWSSFLRRLKYVVIDEIHTYRGVFGSHVAMILRRFRRIASLYGSNPRFIACSATIANPKELAEALTGVEFHLVDRSGAPQGRRHFLFVNPVPESSPYTIATRLFVEAVRSGFRTIAFTKARKITELMHTWINEGAEDIRERISSYRAGFLPEERRTIEERLFGGELQGVISTSALELGVDVGGLDVCILVGYPGTISATWQRSGRVGRKARDSLIILIALEDALDQYFMRNPEDFFRRSAESAVINTKNPVILRAHLECAIAERYLSTYDRVFEVRELIPTLEELEREGRIRRGRKGDIWFPRRRYPHRDVSIREIGDVYTIVDEERKRIGESSSTRVLYELHPGAVYLHRGRHYMVIDLDMEDKRVVCRPADDIIYYTQAITTEETEILSVDERKRMGRVDINLGTLRVTERVIGFRKKHIHTGKIIGEHTLDLPPMIFSTTGIWMRVDEDIIDMIYNHGYSVPGGLHALEHSAIATLPLFALCDRLDLGGVSYPINPELEGAAIFIYDGHEGGIGLTKRGYECIEPWFSSTLRLIEECGCEVSCPSCTQDPKCGSGNEPLDKRGAIVILREWLELEAITKTV